MPALAPPWPVFLSMRRRRRAASTVNLQSDMMAAVVRRLRLIPAIVAALNEDRSSVTGTKIWADDLAFKPDLPYLTYSETRGSKVYVFGGNYTEKGTFDLNVYASEKAGCRTLAQRIIDALNDQANQLVFHGGAYLYIREDLNSAQTVQQISIGTAIAYHRVVTIHYIITGTIGV